MIFCYIYQFLLEPNPVETNETLIMIHQSLHYARFGISLGIPTPSLAIYIERADSLSHSRLRTRTHGLPPLKRSTVRYYPDLGHHWYPRDYPGASRPRWNCLERCRRQRGRLPQANQWCRGHYPTRRHVEERWSLPDLRRAPPSPPPSTINMGTRTSTPVPSSTTTLRPVARSKTDS
jgi:hypothetical protein